MITPAGCELRTSRVSISPSSPGRLRSIRTMSICRCASTLRIPAPSPATATSKPQNSKYSRIVSRTSLSSSTTRILPLSPIVPTSWLASFNLAQKAEHVIWQKRLFETRRARFGDEGLNFGSKRVTRYECQSVYQIRALSLQGVVQADPVKTRHPNVAQNNIILAVQSPLEPSLTIDGRVNHMALPDKDFPQRVDDFGLVIDNEDVQTLQRSPLLLACARRVSEIRQRQLDRECGAASLSIRYGNLATMRPDNA